MTTLTSIALDVVGQYHHAGKQLVRAYRLGTERAVGAVDARFASAIGSRSLPLIDDAVKASLIDAQRQVSGLVAFGLGVSANGADLAIDQVLARVHQGIERVADTSARVGTAFGTTALEKAGTLVLPVAQVSLNVATAVAQRTTRLSERVSGDDAVIVEQAPAKKPAAKKRAARTRRA